MVVGLVLVMGTAAVVLKRFPSGFGVEVADSGSLASVAPLPPPELVVDAGASEDAGSSEDAGADAGTGLVDVVVEPRVDVSLQGVAMGRTPVTLTLPPGRHVLTFTNPQLGITVARAVTVTAGGRVPLQVYLNKGFLNVRAPAGADVSVDGRPVGKAPVEELDVYEGNHTVFVSVGAARWQRSFKIEPGQRVNFDVDFQEPPPETE